MTPENTNEPNNYNVEYSGSAFGDERDPRSLFEAMDEVLDVINERAKNPALFAVRAELAEITGNKAHGETVDEVRLHELQQEVIRLETEQGQGNSSE